VEEFYKAYLSIENPFSHQAQFWNLVLSDQFPILVKAPTGSGKKKIFPKKFLSGVKNNAL